MFLLASLKIFTNSLYFTGIRIRTPQPPTPNENAGNSKGIGSFSSEPVFVNVYGATGIDSVESILPAYVAWRAGTTNRAGNRFLGSLKGSQIRAQPLKLPIINHPPLMKNNTVPRFKIISGLRNSLQKHRWVPVCRNKQFEEGYWKDFYN
jgi:hypothetical protein